MSHGKRIGELEEGLEQLKAELARAGVYREDKDSVLLGPETKIPLKYFPGTKWEIVDDGDKIKIGCDAFYKDQMLIWLNNPPKKLPGETRIESCSRSHYLEYANVGLEVSAIFAYEASAKWEDADGVKLAMLYKKEMLNFKETIRYYCEKKEEKPWIGRSKSTNRVVLFTKDKRTILVADTVSGLDFDRDGNFDPSQFTPYTPYTPKFKKIAREYPYFGESKKCDILYFVAPAAAYVIKPGPDNTKHKVGDYLDELWFSEQYFTPVEMEKE
jgi:hypothetical protein